MFCAEIGAYLLPGKDAYLAFIYLMENILIFWNFKVENPIEGISLLRVSLTVNCLLL